MPINFANRNSLERFTADNIVDYNQNSKQFAAKKLKEEIARVLHITEEPKFTETEIKPYLSQKLQLHLSDASKAASLNTALDALSGHKKDIRAGIMRIANNEVLSFADLCNYYEHRILDNIQLTYTTSGTFRDSILDRLLSYNTYAADPNTSDQINYVKNTLKISLQKALSLVFSSGFTRNYVTSNTGTNIANEGDSAQFLFLARAILAGFNCSNVDVRSSRYDAVIDYNGHLLRVQIKGISGNTISFKDRDRGGAGVDPSADRNQGRAISSKDIDLFIAVDKQFGLCYIIPASKIDSWVAAGKLSVNVKDLSQYKENWSQISETSSALFP